MKKIPTIECSEMTADIGVDAEHIEFYKANNDGVVVYKVEKKNGRTVYLGASDWVETYEYNGRKFQFDLETKDVIDLEADA